MLPIFLSRSYCKGVVLAHATPQQPKHRYCMRRRACCNQRSSPWLPAAGRAPVHDHRNKIFATTMLFFCWNRPMFLLPPTHLKSATMVIFCWNQRTILLQLFWFCYYWCFVNFCYIHLHDIACFFQSILLQPCFDFAGNKDNFCYNHILILLEPKIIFVTSTRRRWLSFCCNRLGFLLLQELPFCYYQSLARSIRSFCYHPLLFLFRFLLEPA